MTQHTSKILIQVPMKNTGTKVWSNWFVKSVRYADGPGMKLKSWTYTCKREDAALFSLATAMELSVQMFHIVGISLVNENGEKLEETKQVRAEQSVKIEARNEVVREYNRQMQPLVNEIKKIIGGL